MFLRTHGGTETVVEDCGVGLSGVLLSANSVTQMKDDWWVRQRMTGGCGGDDKCDG